ncbi:putative BsuMI modification methylase subunit YdiO [Moorella thermoacetica]|uniref:DNA (cytosine-5-)-methyltransferase n=1 Tax=Neomoorella thermoacetica TaxID=1525 RepID=A0A1J5JPR2_NEOTH|nr:DNA cytosine methyltransferase [Moorella thermoacetica]OIQ08707.1 putative BsuMI modification methylase subunit YdiO [Moorella thermoacetica]
MTREFTVLHLFSGIGGAALGFQQAVEEYKGVVGRFRTLAGIDVDPEACADFEYITGAPAIQMDLFSRADYESFHGHEPPPGWQEVTAGDLLAATGWEHPDVVFLSPPCKGFSGLLPVEKSRSEKYQALNRLVVRGLSLVVEAYQDDLPAVIMLENVPRITSRGECLLRQVKHLLGKHGYAFHEGFHDCGELGGLGQHRKRYLLIARLEQKMTSFIYKPPVKRVKSIGEIIGPLPMPDDPRMGLLHRLPRLQWKTWVRLALIPAGGDWRYLDKIASVRYRLEYVPHNGAFRVGRWDEPATTITGSANVRGSNALAAIADPRLPHRDNRHPAVYQVVKWDEPGPCVTGTRFGSGAPAVGDPRIGCRPRNGTYKVQAWNQPSATVIGAGDIHAGAAAVADPRIPADDKRPDPPPVIIALDGTWHRPLTTLELAVLQGFPISLPNGQPLKLAGKSDARWRERIGNAVPPPAAKAIAEQILSALLVSEKGEWVLGYTGFWVHENIASVRTGKFFATEGLRGIFKSFCPDMISSHILSKQILYGQEGLKWPGKD